MTQKTDINPNAEKHPCMACEYGGMWSEGGQPAGNYCKHPKVTKKHGLYYGRFHTYKMTPKWCPKKGEEGEQ